MTEENRVEEPRDAYDRLAHGAYPFRVTVPMTRASEAFTDAPAMVEKHGNHTAAPLGDAVIPPIEDDAVIPYWVHASAPVDGSDREDRIVP